MADQRLLGMWFEPSEASKPYAGNLTISEDKPVELEILTDLSKFKPSDWSILHGYARGHIYSLVGLIPISYGTSLGTAGTGSETWVARFLFKDIFVSSTDERFERVSFSVDGLQDWSEMTGLTKSMSQRFDDPFIGNQIERQHPEPVTLDGGDLKFTFISTFSYPGTRWGVSLMEDTQVHVAAREPKTVFEWWDEVIVPIQKLIQFSLKTGGTVKRTAVSHKLADQPQTQLERNWYDFIHSWSRRYEFDSRLMTVAGPLFKLSDFISAGQGLKTWLGLYGQYKEPLNAALDGVYGGATLEYQFFTHARLLERLVDGRYPEVDLVSKKELEAVIKVAAPLIDISVQDQFVQKLRSAGRRNMKSPIEAIIRKWSAVVEPLKSYPDMCEWVASKIVDTRNCFAHHDKKACDLAISEYAILWLQALVRTIIDLEIGEMLGFPPETILERLQDTSQYRDGLLLKEERKQDIAESEGQSFSSFLGSQSQ